METLLPNALTTVERVKRLLYTESKKIILSGTPVPNSYTFSVENGLLQDCAVGNTFTLPLSPSAGIFTITAIDRGYDNEASKNIYVDKLFQDSQEFRQKIVVDTSPYQYDSLLIQLINEVTDFINTRTGDRNFLKTEYVEETYTNINFYNQLVFLKQAPIREVKELWYGTGVQLLENWIPYQSQNWNYFNGINDGKNLSKLNAIRVDFSFANRVRNFKITYTAGYDISWSNVGNTTLHNLPLELSGVAERLVIRHFVRRDLGDLKSNAVQGASLTYESELLPMDKEILDRYLIIKNI